MLYIPNRNKIPTFKCANILIIIILTISFPLGKSIAGIHSEYCKFEHFKYLPPDTLPDNQGLYNGRVWQNLYYRIEGDQFLFSGNFLQGSVTMNGRKYNNILIKYDIYSDEILVPGITGKILQLNKELVDSFSISFADKKYQFVREDSLENVNGYINVIYKGKSKLYAKYLKKIDRPAVENRHDYFYQVNRIYFVKGSTPYEITSKSDLLKLMGEDKTKIKAFIKANNILVSRDMPESFAPIVAYYDKINP